MLKKPRKLPKINRIYHDIYLKSVSEDYKNCEFICRRCGHTRTVTVKHLRSQKINKQIDGCKSCCKMKPMPENPPLRIGHGNYFVKYKLANITNSTDLPYYVITTSPLELDPISEEIIYYDLEYDKVFHLNT